ncbi:MAG: GNAT family N-acetyltransferase [Candidatus Aminicenantes bacterium]|nr:GNAT family N-acetyltransferase [Candidatus Aminicenantes bacterium]
MAKPLSAPRSPGERTETSSRRNFDQDIVLGHQDREGLTALAKIIFPGEDVSDPRYLIWLYDQNPGGQAIEFVTKTGTLVTGHCAGVPLKFKIGAVVRPGCLAVNGMTHPDYRGRGIFFRLYGEVTARCAKSGIDLTFGYPNSNSLGACLHHLNYREIGDLPLWILPFNLPRVLAVEKSKKGILWRACARLGNPFLRLAVSVIRPRRKSRSMTIEKITEFSAEFDAFWESVKDDFTHILVRDRDFLDWRFAHHPTRRYEIFTARLDGRLIGFLVGSVTKIENLLWGMIVDLLVADSPEGKTAAVLLASAFLREARSRGAALVGCLMLKRRPAAKALRRNGFLVCPRRLLPRRFPILLSWNASEPAPAGLFDTASWFITLGDFDAV